MQAFENTVTIQRPAEEVFAFLADFENIPRWNYAIEETKKARPASVRTLFAKYQGAQNYALLLRPMLVPPPGPDTGEAPAAGATDPPHRPGRVLVRSITCQLGGS